VFACGRGDSFQAGVSTVPEPDVAQPAAPHTLAGAAAIYHQLCVLNTDLTSERIATSTTANPTWPRISRTVISLPPRETLAPHIRRPVRVLRSVDTLIRPRSIAVNTHPMTDPKVLITPIPSPSFNTHTNPKHVIKRSCFVTCLTLPWAVARATST
jgi:hypothetical protein